MLVPQLLDDKSEVPELPMEIPYRLDRHLDDAALFSATSFITSCGLFDHQADHGKALGQVLAGLVSWTVGYLDQIERIQTGLLVQIELNEASAQEPSAVHERLAVVDHEDLGVGPAEAGHQLLHHHRLAGTGLPHDAGVVIAG